MMTPTHEPRFARPLTDTEFAAVTLTATHCGAGDALAVLWDIILLDAEGTTRADLAREGRVVRPADYAIPDYQAAALRQVLNPHPARPLPGHLMLLWAVLSPAVYPTGDAADEAQRYAAADQRGA